MILKEITNKVKFESNLESVSFTFDEKNASHFFNLVANLYADPVTAVLREIGANCVDSVRDASNGNGWELHLPTSFDPLVRFVDHGLGISPEDFMSLYNVVGASTKRADAEQIGGFGVGRVSLFALVNNFTAISRHNGTISRYFLSKQPNGLPQISIVSQEPTTEENGFEVQFTCPQRFQAEFASKYVNVYRFFTVKPSVYEGNSLVTPPFAWVNEKDNEYKYISLDKSMKIGGNATRNSLIVMGGVGYRLPLEVIKEDHKFTRFMPLLNEGAFIFANIGDYSVTPSREAIQFDDYTSVKLFAYLEKLVNEIVPNVQKQMDNFEGNTLQAKLFLKSTTSVFAWAGEGIFNNIQWKGKTLDLTPISLKGVPNTTLVPRSYRSTIDVKENEVEALMVSEKTEILIDDLKRGTVARGKFLIKSDPLTSGGYSSYGKRPVVTFIPKDQVQNFIKLTGWIGDIKLASTLPVPPYTPKATTGRGVCNYSVVKFVKEGCNHHQRCSFNPFDINKVDGRTVIFFPVLDGKSYDLDSRKITSSIDAMKVLQISGYPKGFVAAFVIAKQFAKMNDASFHAMGGMTAREFFNKPLIANSIEQGIAASKVDYSYEDQGMFNFFTRKLKGFDRKDFSTSSPVILLLNTIEAIAKETCSTNRGSWVPLEELCGKLNTGIKLDKKKDVKAFDSLNIQLKKDLISLEVSYPLLPVMKTAIDGGYYRISEAEKYCPVFIQYLLEQDKKTLTPASK